MKACGWHSEYNDQCADCRHGNLPPVRSSDWLAAFNDQLDIRIEEMKQELRACDTASQKNAIGTAILTVNAIAWALRDARKQMAAMHDSKDTSNAEASFAPCPGSAAAWINQQSELLICVRTMLVGPAVVIREGHHVIGTGETLEEAVASAIKKQQNADISHAGPAA